MPVHIHGLTEGVDTSVGASSDDRTPSFAQVFTVCPPDIRRLLEALPKSELNGLEEIRLRLGQPVQLCGSRWDRFLHEDAGVTERLSEGIRVTADHLSRVIASVTQSSLYAVEEDVRRGFVTMPGGHRVGVAGRVVVGDSGAVRSMRSVYSVNIRIAREQIDCAKPLCPYLYDRISMRPYSLILISPPQCGKTTLLRDLIRIWSSGFAAAGVPAAKVTVVDERSEIAGCVDGIPQFDMGPRTDVLDGCPKSEGLSMAIRSLSPTIVATDEIGSVSDTAAVLDATHAGVQVFASAHAASVDEFSKRPAMANLIETRAFQRYIVLSRRSGPGTVEQILDADFRRVYSRTTHPETKVNLS